MLLTVHGSLFTWHTTHPASSQPSERHARVKGISQSGFGVKVLLEKGFLRYQFGIRYGIIVLMSLSLKPLYYYIKLCNWLMYFYSHVVIVDLRGRTVGEPAVLQHTQRQDTIFSEIKK